MQERSVAIFANTTGPTNLQLATMLLLLTNTMHRATVALGAKVDTLLPDDSYRNTATLAAPSEPGVAAIAPPQLKWQCTARLQAIDDVARAAYAAVADFLAESMAEDGHSATAAAPSAYMNVGAPPAVTPPETAGAAIIATSCLQPAPPQQGIVGAVAVTEHAATAVSRAHSAPMEGVLEHDAATAALEDATTPAPAAQVTATVAAAPFVTTATGVSVESAAADESKQPTDTAVSHGVVDELQADAATAMEGIAKPVTPEHAVAIAAMSFADAEPEHASSPHMASQHVAATPDVPTPMTGVQVGTTAVTPVEQQMVLVATTPVPRPVPEDDATIEDAAPAASSAPITSLDDVTPNASAGERSASLLKPIGEVRTRTDASC